MPTRYQPALDLARMRPKNFAEALRLLLGDYCEDRGEKLRAMRRLVRMIWWIESDFTDPERPPRVSEVRQLLRESREAAEKLRRVILPLSTRLTPGAISGSTCVSAFSRIPDIYGWCFRQEWIQLKFMLC